jgi:hypothetical protein
MPMLHRDSDHRERGAFSCCRVGPEHGEPACGHWRDFDRQYTLAHARGLLRQAAQQGAECPRSDGLGVTRENLDTALIMAVADARPRSLLVPWFMVDETITEMIGVVVGDFFRRAGMPS